METDVEKAFLRDTRASYDAIAADYEERFGAETKPLERAMLASFAARVRADGAGPVVEFGSGPGRVSACLAGLGVDIRGVDLSPAMVALARRAYPQLRFDEGSMTELGGFVDGSLAGVVAWYSMIHLPPAEVPGVLGGFHRLLAPGGHLAVAFQVGEEISRYTEAFGHSVSLDFHRMRPDLFLEQLRDAGFEVRVRLEREPEKGEKTPQAYLIARRPNGE